MGAFFFDGFDLYGQAGDPTAGLIEQHWARANHVGDGIVCVEGRDGGKGIHLTAQYDASVNTGGATQNFQQITELQSLDLFPGVDGDFIHTGFSFKVVEQSEFINFLAIGLYGTPFVFGQASTSNEGYILLYSTGLIRIRSTGGSVVDYNVDRDRWYNLEFEITRVNANEYGLRIYLDDIKIFDSEQSDGNWQRFTNHHIFQTRGGPNTTSGQIGTRRNTNIHLDHFRITDNRLGKYAKIDTLLPTGDRVGFDNWTPIGTAQAYEAVNNVPAGAQEIASPDGSSRQDFEFNDTFLTDLDSSQTRSSVRSNIDNSSFFHIVNGSSVRLFGAETTYRLDSIIFSRRGTVMATAGLQS